MKFRVIDNKTGKEPDLWNIALREEWAKSLVYCDIEGFVITEDGYLMLADECGHVVYCDPERFKVVFEDDRQSGEWKFVQRGKFVDMVCPICGFVREEGIAYNMTVEEVLDTISKDDFRVHGKSVFPNYCENCGAKMCVRVKRRG